MLPSSYIPGVWAGLAPALGDSGNVTGEYYAMLQQQGGGLSLPDSIPVQPSPLPVFRTEVEQIDLLRLAMLALGVIIGMKVFSKR